MPHSPRNLRPSGRRGCQKLPPQEPKAGVSNGKALGYIANKETRAKLRERYKRGELVGVNPAIINAEFAFKGIS